MVCGTGGVFCFLAPPERVEAKRHQSRQDERMNTSTALWPGFELQIDQDVQYVELGGNELNPEWRHVDSNGHGHFVSLDKADRLPTLVWVSVPCTMGHGDDCDSEGWYECKVCGEEIRPGSRPARPLRIDGPKIYTLTSYGNGVRTVYRFGETEWKAIQGAVEKVVDGILADFVIEISR